MIRYSIPAGVEPVYSNNLVMLSTREGGRVIIDRMTLALWQTAKGHSLPGVLSELSATQAHPLHIRAGLACLAEAGLIEREGYLRDSPASPSYTNGLVSVVIVSYNSAAWLESCLVSLAAQTHIPFEIIVVDNASQDNSADWIEEQRPEVRLLRLEGACPLAQALNLGIRLASGDYFLLLNPDVKLEPGAIAQMLQVAQKYPSCAAVAAKLRLLWTPNFLNGLGNLVGRISWGTDIGLGHLDLGQFDAWEQLPSACFAAALIPSQAILKIGLLDEQFPMYYEDSEWCYRARLYGYTIQAAPQALIYHAFGARKPAESVETLSPTKLRRVIFGRLNFITKINDPSNFLRFMFNYILEDLTRFAIAAIRRRWAISNSILQGWQDYLRALPELRQQRREIQSRRCLTDQALYQVQSKAPVPLIQDGLPQLSWDSICSIYSPLILSGQTRAAPEMQELNLDERQEIDALVEVRIWERTRRIWRIEGAIALLRWAVRNIHWRILRS